MRPCRKTCAPRRAAEPGAVQNRGEAVSPHVNRYSHPIQIKGGACSDSTDELLSHILETLSRQSGLLEELLRRTEKEDTR